MEGNNEVKKKKDWLFTFFGIMAAIWISAIFNKLGNPKNDEEPEILISTPKKNENINSRRTMLLTASGILVAVLLVWAQLWTDTAKGYEYIHESLITAGYGLLFVYYAMLASLIGFIIILFSKRDLRAGLVPFLVAIIIAITEVLITTISVFYKTWFMPEKLLQPTVGSSDCLYQYSGWFHWGLMVVFPLIVIVICIILVYFCRFTKKPIKNFGS